MRSRSTYAYMSYFVNQTITAIWTGFDTEYDVYMALLIHHRPVSGVFFVWRRVYVHMDAFAVVRAKKKKAHKIR